MPKLYEYFGLIIMFYANEYEPVHVHGKYQERESRAEIIVVNGVITEIRYADVAGALRWPLRRCDILKSLFPRAPLRLSVNGLIFSCCTNR